MTTFMQRLRTVVKAEVNTLLDKVVDMNSIPVLKQYVRDLEDAIGKTQHEAAVSAASIVTLNRQKGDLQHTIDHDRSVVTAYLAKTDEKNARLVATRIQANTEQANSLQQQIDSAKEQSQQLETVVEQLNTKHTQIVSRVRILETKDRSAKSIESATTSLKAAGGLLNNDVNSSIDNLSQKIDARNDVAQEEFRRTVGGFETAPDPVTDAAVDDILNSLRPAKSATT